MSTFQRYATFLSLLLPLAVAAPSAVHAQQPAAPAGPEVTDERLRAYVGAFLDRIKIQDEYDQKLALVANKDDESQEVLREERREGILKAFQAHGLTQQEFTWITYVVAVDNERRQAFETMLEAVKNQTP